MHDSANPRASGTGRRRDSAEMRRSAFVLAGVFLLAALSATPVLAATPVRVALVRPAITAETLRLTGTVTARQSAGLSPRLSGLVHAVHVDAGDRVGAGDVLLELDHDVAELELQQAKAALDEGRSRLAEAQRLHREASQLVAERHLPETELHARAASIELNTAMVARLEADVREAAELLERHQLVAPFAGVISRKRAEVGEWVETGTPVLDLVDIEHLRLDVQVPQERFAEIDTTTPVTVHLDGGAAEALPARVIAKVPVNDPTARTFLVRVEIRDAHGRIIPGMSAQAEFDIAGADRALSVPRDALVRQPDGSYRVWIVDESDGEPRAFPRDVTIGRSLAASIEVLSGLEDGMRAIVRGNETLREGQPVEVRQSASTAR